MILVAAQFSVASGDDNYGRFIDNEFNSGFWFGRDLTNVALNGGFVQPNPPYGAAIAYPDNTQFLMFSTRNGATTTNIVNSSLATSISTSAGLTPLNPIRIGAISSLAGFFGRKYHQEYVLYYTDQSTIRNNIEFNINTYYNIY
jgi:hypothetical protein